MVHPAIVDFAERALESTDIRLYQSAASAKYAGVTNYEQPMHVDRNHSWLPAGSESPWWNLEGFLYLTDVTAEDNPTRLVDVRDTAHIDNPWGVVMPYMEPGRLRGGAARRQASGAPTWPTARTAGTGARPSVRAPVRAIVLAIAFKNAGVEWIGYDTQQSRSTGLEWTAFAEGCTARELEPSGGRRRDTRCGPSGWWSGRSSATRASTSTRGARRCAARRDSSAPRSGGTGPRSTFLPGCSPASGRGCCPGRRTM